MLEKTKLLLELQELDLILSEAKIVHDEPQEEELTAKIAQLREQLDKDSLSRYDRLSKQGPPIVHMRGGMCLGCNLTVPQGDLNRMQGGKMLPLCPNCGRFLNL